MTNANSLYSKNDIESLLTLLSEQLTTKHNVSEALSAFILHTSGKTREVFDQLLIQIEREKATAKQTSEYILEGAALGAWDWWLETNKVHFDRRWLEMLGLDPINTPHELSTWDRLVHPDDKEKAYADIKAHIDGKTRIYENIHRLRHADGHWVWILDRGRISQYSDGGKPIRFTGTHFDITHYKEAQILSDSIQHIAHIGGWELDPETGTTTWTSETYKIYGIPEHTPTDKIIGISYYAPHERERITKCVRECIQGKSYRDVFEFIDANGNQKWVEAMGEPVIDSNGKVYKLRGTFQDVTARKKTELDLVESQSLAKLGSWKCNLATKEKTWSSEAYKIFEIPEPQTSDMLSELYRERIAPEDLPKFDYLLSQARTHGKNFVFTHKITLDEGRRFKHIRMACRVTLDENGSPAFMAGTYQDITDIVTLEEKNRFILNAMGIGLWEYNPVIKKLLWHDSMYQLFGLNRGDFSSDHAASEHILTNESHVRILAEMQLALNGIRDLNYQFEVTNQLNELKHITFKGTVYKDSNGTAQMMYGICWDSTKEVQMEQKLALERARTIQNAKLASLGEMSAGIAHEINNPLAVIVGNIALIRQTLPSGEKLLSKLTAIEKSTARIEKIVRGLRKFSRTSSGNDFKIENLNELLTEALVLTEAKAKKNDVTISTNIKEKVELYCDAVEIEQVLVNLINNSIDAIKELPEKWIKIECDNREGGIRLAIIDSGAGVPKEIAQKMFQPFFTTKAIGEGTGLGLSITKGILDQHKATIQINQNNPNTCFEIYFSNTARSKAA